MSTVLERHPLEGLHIGIVFDDQTLGMFDGERELPISFGRPALGFVPSPQVPARVAAQIQRLFRAQSYAGLSGTTDRAPWIHWTSVRQTFRLM